MTTMPSASPEWLFRHAFGDQNGWIVTFTGRQARLDNDDARPNELARTEQRYFSYPQSVESACSYVLNQADRERDAYFGVHLFRERGNRLARNAAPYVECLWLDEDEGRFPETGPEPTMVVDSSAGRRHLYWKLNRAIAATDAVELNRRIAVWSCGDVGKAGLASVLRPPGTSNYKRFPQVDQVVSTSTGVAEWEPEVVDQAIPQLPPPQAERKQREAGEGYGERYDGPRLELVDYLSASGIETFGEAPDECGLKLAVLCPWASEHSGGDRTGTYAGQLSGGALWFHCHHEHCLGRTWRDLKEKVTPQRPGAHHRKRSRRRKVYKTINKGLSNA